MGIESEIPEDLFGSAKGLFCIHDPFLAIELLGEAPESILSFWMVNVPGHDKASFFKGLPERVDEFAPEFLRQGTHRHEKAVA